MSKFIACTDGSYVNIKHITSFHASHNEVIVFFFDGNSGDHAYLVKNLESKQQAQEWLDKFMMKYDFALGVVKEN